MLRGKLAQGRRAAPRAGAWLEIERSGMGRGEPAQEMRQPLSAAPPAAASSPAYPTASRFRPASRRPIARGVDDVENDDALASGSRLNRVGDDVWQTCNGFLECAVHPAFAPSAMNAKLFAGLPNRRRNLSRRFRILPRNVGRRDFQIVQRGARPKNRPRHLPSAANSIAASSSSMASSCGTSRPAFISASPRAMASRI